MNHDIYIQYIHNIYIYILYTLKSVKKKTVKMASMVQKYFEELLINHWGKNESWGTTTKIRHKTG